MTEPVLAYFTFMAVNLVISSVSAITFVASIWPHLAYGIAGIAALSLVCSAVVLGLLVYGGLNNQDTDTPEEDNAQMAYLSEWRTLKSRKKVA